MSKGTFTATGTFTTSGGGGRGYLVAAAAVVVILVGEWVFGHVWWLLGITVGIGGAGAFLYVLAVRYHERRGVIVAAGFAELHAHHAELPPHAPPAVVNHYHQDIHIHGSAPEQVAAVIRQAIPGRPQ
jgi:hypothetical protein